MKHFSTLLVTLVLSINLPLTAMAAEHTIQTSAEKASLSTSIALSPGEVKKIDKESGKITIKHGPLSNLDMPAMTMVFRVKDPAILDSVKAGDKVGFVVEKINGALTVTRLEPAK
jgi:Cu(I)/Ag(I) efflux system periplasmic protein CusF